MNRKSKSERLSFFTTQHKEFCADTWSQQCEATGCLFPPLD